MKSFLRNFSSCFAFPTRRPSALERAVRSTPQGRRLRLEALENRSLLAVDALGAAASLDVGESWGPEPEPAFSASELASAAEASPSISLAALNAVPFGPYVTSEQAALIASRSNATLADETIADFGSLWDELDAAETPDVSSCASTVVGETLALEPLDLGEIEQEPLPGDAAPASGASGSTGGGNSGGNAVVSFGVSGGVDGSYVMPGTSCGTNAAILEGQTIFFTLSPKSGNIDNCVVTATLSGMEAGVDYTGSSIREITLNSYGGSFSVQTLADYGAADEYDVGDETLTITLSVTSGTATLETTSYTVKVVEKPEFISDVDEGPTSPDSNDSYRAYIKRDYAADGAISLRTSIGATGGSLQYSLVQPSELFQINAATGAITLKTSAEAYLATHPEQTVRPLTIKAQDSRFSGYSGGAAYSDTATVNIVLSEWTVNRNNGATASAVAVDGCTIADLAKQVGLTASEFEYWLTKNDQATYELFDGSTVTGAQLTASSVLAATSSVSVASFAVPNTIYMAWFGELGGVGKAGMNWSANQTELGSLGFRVATFDNDGYDSNNAPGARNAFLNGIWSLTYGKSIHGLYMMGHGSETAIGSAGTNVYTQGPEWNVAYGSVPGENIIGPSMQNPGLRSITTIGDALNYRLGAVIAHACDSGVSDAQYLVTQTHLGGIFWGWGGGTYTPGVHDNEPIAKHWGRKITPGTSQDPGILGSYTFTIGGKQETGTFQVSRAANSVWEPIEISAE